MCQGGQYLMAVVLSLLLMQTAPRPLNDNSVSNSTSSKASPSWFQVTSSGPGCLVPELGETVQLTCTVKGALQSQMTITWYRANNWYNSCCAVKVLSRCFGHSCVEIETTAGSETNVTMKIVGYNEIHSGIYFCVVTDALIPEAKITSTPTEIKSRDSPSLVSLTQCNDTTTCPYPLKSVPQFSPADICTPYHPSCMPPALSDINLYVTSGTTTAVFSLQWKTSIRECTGYLWTYRICPFNTANVPSHYSMNTNVKDITCGSQGVSGVLNRSTKTIKQHNAKQGWYYIMQVRRVATSEVEGKPLEATFTSAPLYVGKYVPASITAAPSEITVGRPGLLVKLWCNVTGEPQPEVFFLKVLNSDSSIPNPAGGKAPPAGSTTTLHSQYIYAGENATYMCAARNTIIAKDRGYLNGGDFAWIQVRRV